MKFHTTHITTHIADRFHLLKNLTEALKRLLERNHKQVKEAISNDSETVHFQVEEIKKRHAKRSTPKMKNRSLLAEKKFNQVKKLHKRGMLISKICTIVGINLETARHYISLNKFPDRHPRSTKRNIAKYEQHIQKRVTEEPTITIKQLYNEIKKLGYKGSYSSSLRALNLFVKEDRFVQKPVLNKYIWRPAQTSFLLSKKESLLTAEEKQIRDSLCKASDEISRSYKLTQIFRDMMEAKNGKHLHLWTDLVTKEPLNIKELKSFANGLHSDYHAVVNALTLPYSNGQVEGQINKLKTIKRQMFGRAGFSLLRKRLILSSA